MLEKQNNIILIGMPGSGKSTIGAILAKMTSRSFVDTDALIESKEGRSLQTIVGQDGYLALRAVEERVLLDLDCRDHVIATGGSAVYSPAAMEHLRKDGVIVFLDLDLDTLMARVTDFDARGLAKRPDQSMSDLFSERNTLYRQYADITVDCAVCSHEEVCSRIIDGLAERERRGPSR